MGRLERGAGDRRGEGTEVNLTIVECLTEKTDLARFAIVMEFKIRLMRQCQGLARHQPQHEQSRPKQPFFRPARNQFAMNPVVTRMDFALKGEFPQPITW